MRLSPTAKWRRLRPDALPGLPPSLPSGVGQDKFSMIQFPYPTDRYFQCLYRLFRPRKMHYRPISGGRFNGTSCNIRHFARPDPIAPLGKRALALLVHFLFRFPKRAVVGMALVVKKLADERLRIFPAITANGAVVACDGHPPFYLSWGKLLHRTLLPFPDLPELTFGTSIRS